MLLIHGIYRFSTRRVAFRNDYCLSCGGERLAIRLRSFLVLHLFWIPVLPLGFWGGWVCAVCGRPPAATGKTRRGWRIAAAAAIGLAALIFWVVPAPEAERALAWSLRAATTVALVVALRWARADPVQSSYKTRLAAVVSYASSLCPFCGGQMNPLPGWHCETCRVARE